MNNIFKPKDEIIYYKKKIEKNKSQSCFILIDGIKHKLLLNRFDDLYFVNYDINIYVKENK